MKIARLWHRIVRKFTPPGNRAPLDESYRQPVMHQGDHGTPSEGTFLGQQGTLGGG
jgi:hypothetical protein